MLNLEEDQKAFKVLAADIYDDLIRANPKEVIDHFKLNKHKNDPTALFTLNTKTGGLVIYIRDKENICLTADQARYFYKKVEQKGIINVDTIKQEIEEDRLNKNDIEEEVNPYHNIIINDFDRETVITSQMEQ